MLTWRKRNETYKWTSSTEAKKMDKAPTTTSAIFPVRFHNDLFDSKMASIIPISPDSLVDDVEFGPSNLNESQVGKIKLYNIYGTTGRSSKSVRLTWTDRMLNIHWCRRRNSALLFIKVKYVEKKGEVAMRVACHYIPITYVSLYGCKCAFWTE